MIHLPFSANIFFNYYYHSNYRLCAECVTHLSPRIQQVLAYLFKFHIMIKDYGYTALIQVKWFGCKSPSNYLVLIFLFGTSFCCLITSLIPQMNWAGLTHFTAYKYKRKKNVKNLKPPDMYFVFAPPRWKFWLHFEEFWSQSGQIFSTQVWGGSLKPPEHIR